ncbi:hypothetical protein PPL_07565 [Heterostelium album PN500]|uniref:Uncharacterized protein n=1 Tax=Heterostelium pallidum (strain ATCC 26659 / Pp 5 / PN500) TaxID=670386 RepID=D3BGB4_HETP5|nr:hypothetical protein PPL_07565 [Heterostelium album PN500]EFA79514.1 hypothetical protein PPL_07565 [Heterostelium album PN500]|eukprot:XP_020431635.1 hypothetical protein PPL_07565 [Heterostelium album PN500]
MKESAWATLFVGTLVAYGVLNRPKSTIINDIRDLISHKNITNNNEITKQNSVDDTKATTVILATPNNQLPTLSIDNLSNVDSSLQIFDKNNTIKRRVFFS